jgi:hypothetical protein
MATRSSKNATSTTERTIVADLKPKDTDVKYYGSEPLFAIQPDSDLRSLSLGIAFNWYSRFCNNRDAKDFLITYADQTDRKDTAKLLARVDEREVMPTLGWLSRMYLRGFNLSAEESMRLSNELDRLVESIAKPTNVSIDEQQAEKIQPARPNVQEIMRERTREVAGEIEGWLDDFIIDGAKPHKIDVNAIGIMTERNIMPQHVSILTDVWKTKLAEFELALAGTDQQLAEAYSHYSKAQLKAVIKFCEAVLASLNSYISVKKATQAPRKRKPVSPEKQASKMKYLKEFAELKLTSIAPAKIIGATEIFMYDTLKRKLYYYVADSHIGTMTVKGTTVVGFDATKSGIKTLRKPAEVLKRLMTGGKPASRKVFGEVNAVHAQPNGRTNENILILKAY